MTTINDVPDDALFLTYDHLPLTDLASLFVTGQGAARRYLEMLLRTGRLQELGNAYTQDGQHAGVPAWTQIRNPGVDALGTQRAANPTAADLARLVRLMHDNNDEIRRYP